MTFNAGVEADLSASTFAFAKVGRGFKAGGFNDSVPGNNYDPETLTSYEAGIKGRAWDRRIQYALSVFYSQYKDIQVSIIPPGASVVYENAAEGTIWGIDFQGSVDVGSGVSVDTALSYIPTAKYDEYLSRDPFGLTCGNATVECNLSGNRLNRVPRFSGTFGLNYRHQLEEERAVTARVELYRASATVYSAFDYPGATEPAYTLLNAYLSADVTPQLTLRLYGKNLTDKLYMSGRVPNSGVNHIFGYYGRPREFGAEAALRF
jgi:iron complex outermembrane receptor protein